MFSNFVKKVTVDPRGISSNSGECGNWDLVLEIKIKSVDNVTNAKLNSKLTLSVPADGVRTEVEKAVNGWLDRWEKEVLLVGKESVE